MNVTVKPIKSISEIIIEFFFRVKVLMNFKNTCRISFFAPIYNVVKGVGRRIIIILYKNIIDNIFVKKKRKFHFKRGTYGDSDVHNCNKIK